MVRVVDPYGGFSLKCDACMKNRPTTKGLKDLWFCSNQSTNGKEDMKISGSGTPDNLVASAIALTTAAGSGRFIAKASTRERLDFDALNMEVAEQIGAKARSKISAADSETSTAKTHPGAIIMWKATPRHIFATNCAITRLVPALSNSIVR